MGSEIMLDVRELSAPEPLQQVMAVLPTMVVGQFLHVLHRRDAQCLCRLMTSLGFEHVIDGDAGAGFEIWIWQNADNLAALAVQAARQH